MTTLENRTIVINEGVFKELEYMVNLHKESGANYQCGTVQELVNYVLSSVADGSRRPGAWERQMLEMMGLVAKTGEHHIYRENYFGQS